MELKSAVPCRSARMDGCARVAGRRRHDIFLAARIGLALLYAFGHSQPYSDLLERCWRS